MTRLTVAFAFALAALVAASAAVAAPPPSTDAVWVGGTTHDLTVTGPADASARAIPLYVIAPVDRFHPLHSLADARAHGFGAHDHVVALTKPGTTFDGVCDLTLVVAGPKAKLGKTARARLTPTPAGVRPLLYAAVVGGRLVPLTSAGRIRSAVREKLATVVDTHNPLVCEIRPRTNA